MNRAFLPFLDLMLGFIGAMYVVISVSAGARGEREVEAPKAFLLASVKVYSDERIWTPAKPVLRISEATINANVLPVFWSGEAMVFHLVCSDEPPQVATDSQPIMGASVTLRLDEDFLEGRRVGVWVTGELSTEDRTLELPPGGAVGDWIKKEVEPALDTETSITVRIDQGS